MSIIVVGLLFQHTAARRRLEPNSHSHQPKPQFQHTAARRRLDQAVDDDDDEGWFQHTAARRRLGGIYNDKGTPYGFNTQPPEGGWWIPFRPLPRD